MMIVILGKKILYYCDKFFEKEKNYMNIVKNKYYVWMLNYTEKRIWNLYNFHFNLNWKNVFDDII